MFNSEDFKRVMSYFATGVVVILTKDNENRLHGMTVNSFNSVSLNPALVLYSVNKKNNNLSVYINTEKFTVNILSNNQVNLSNYFASSDKNLETFQDYSSSNDAIIINESLGYLLCKIWKVVDAGDHFIIIGEVLHLSVGDFDGIYKNNLQPLVYFNKNYYSLCQKIDDK